jgi:tetratricopeptide (TPR) repeat protein
MSLLMDALKKAEKAKNKAKETVGTVEIAQTDSSGSNERSLTSVADKVTPEPQSEETVTACPASADDAPSQAASKSVTEISTDDNLAPGHDALTLVEMGASNASEVPSETALAEATQDEIVADQSMPGEAAPAETVVEAAATATATATAVENDIVILSSASEVASVDESEPAESAVEVDLIDQFSIEELSPLDPDTVETAAELASEPAPEKTPEQISEQVQAQLAVPTEASEPASIQQQAPKIAAKLSPEAAADKKEPERVIEPAAEQPPKLKTPPIIGVGAKRRAGRHYLWSGLVLFFVMVLGAMVYYFNMVLDETGHSVAVIPAAQPVAEASVAAVVAQEEASQSLVASGVPQQVPVNETVKAKIEPAVTTEPVSPQQVVSATPTKTSVATLRPAAIKKPQPVTQPVRPVATPPAAIEISRDQRRDPLEMVLQQAYQAYQRGEYQPAELNYRRALEIDADNRDARLGLAVIAQRSGRIERARLFYQSLLVLNPKDSIAHTGLMSLQGASASGDNETHIKMLLAEEPTAAHLHFALGVEYVAQTRWPEAQQAFFRAYRYAPGNAEYSFNLAVSLEQLRQPNAALDYYRRAREAAVGKAVGFELDELNQRIAKLSAQEVAR